MPDVTFARIPSLRTHSGYLSARCASLIRRRLHLIFLAINNINANHSYYLPIMQASNLDTGLATPKPLAEKSRSRRFTFLKWLRKVHGWIGLWGAVLGLLFGVTGFLQNHRATMKIKVGTPAVSTVQIAVPNPPPASPRELAKFLRSELKLDGPT